MKFTSRPLNRGEIFPCSSKSAKDMFKDTTIHLHFANISRDFGTFANTFDYFYVRKNVSGQIIASMYMYPIQEHPILSFYVLKQKEYPYRLQQEFEHMVLPQILSFYHERRCDTINKERTKVLLVELIDKTFAMHTFFMT